MAIRAKSRIQKVRQMRRWEPRFFRTVRVCQDSGLQRGGLAVLKGGVGGGGGEEGDGIGGKDEGNWRAHEGEGECKVGAEEG